MSEPQQKATFSFTWEILLSEIASISTKPIQKNIVTTFKNFPLFWRVCVGSTIFPDTSAESFGLCFYYDDGPFDQVDVDGSCYIIRADKAVGRSRCDLTHCFQRGKGHGWTNFETKDVGVLKSKYGHKGSLIFDFSLKIPSRFFDYKIENPLSVLGSGAFDYLRSSFENVEDQHKALYSNATLVSNDDRRFYCHEHILGLQSDVFRTMFLYPATPNGNEYKLGVDGQALKPFLAYLYTRQPNIETLLTKEVIQLADLAEQHGVQQLKVACASVLWQRCDGSHENIVSIFRFADLHQDQKYLKHRAMDILAEAWSKEKITILRLKELLDNEDGRGDWLLAELDKYSRRRVVPRYRPASA